MHKAICERQEPDGKEQASGRGHSATGPAPLPIQRLIRLAEKSLVALLLLLFCLPLLHRQGEAAARRVHAAFCKWNGQPAPRAASAGKKKRRPPGGTADWKQDIARAYNEDFLFRKELIRATNEAFYRLWRVSPAPVAGVTIGKGDVLLETGYLSEYCLQRPAQESLLPLVRKLRRFQDICDRRGVKFALLITPSKPSILPETVPDEWRARYDPRPRSYDLILPLLQSHGVRYVDGHALTRAAKDNAPAPVFSKGGTHWSYHAALPTANALLDCLARQGAPVAPLETSAPWISHEPKGADTDLLAYINLALPWHYPIAEFTIQPAGPAHRTPPRKLTFVGGSFTWQIAQEIEAASLFGEVDVFYYYRLYKAINLSIVRDTGSRREPTGPVDFENEIYNSDCIVLEVNESVLATQRHLNAFFDDAFAHAEQREALSETLAR